MKEPIGVEENILFFYSATEYHAKNKGASTGKKKRNEKRGCFCHSFHIRIGFLCKKTSIAAASNCLRNVLQWH